MEALGLWIPLVISVVSAIVAVFSLLRQINRDRPDIAETYENMATRQAERITRLQITVTEMELEIKALKSIIDEWTKGITILTDQIESSGEKPCWRPKKVEP